MSAKRAGDVRRIWAPWRTRFFYRRGRAPRGCIFCTAVRSRADRKHLVFRRSRHAFAILNLYPYNNGHVMIAPRRHVADLSALTDGELVDVWRLVGAVQTQITRLLKAQGFNVGINLGRVAGAGIPGHLHVHLVPRWLGDTNFMPIIGWTKVISQSLEELHDRLTARTTR